jgi:predicted transcriptional regulator
VTLISFQGTKKSRQKGPKIRMIPTRKPDGQTLSRNSHANFCDTCLFHEAKYSGGQYRSLIKSMEKLMQSQESCPAGLAIRSLLTERCSTSGWTTLSVQKLVCSMRLRDAGVLRTYRRMSAFRVSNGPLPDGLSALGPLETKVLELLWHQGGAATVRHVLHAFPELAYTTLMTTLDRLYRKGLLVRQRRGRAFTYEPRCSREQLLSELVSGHVMGLLSASHVDKAILSTLVHCVGRKDAALLDELDALVQAERARLQTVDK